MHCTIDDIALLTQIISDEELPTPQIYTAAPKDEQYLTNIYRFLTTLETPNNSIPQDQKQFIKRVTQFYVKSGIMWRCSKKGNPFLVILDKERQVRILTKAHEEDWCNIGWLVLWVWKVTLLWKTVSVHCTPALTLNKLNKADRHLPLPPTTCPIITIWIVWRFSWQLSFQIFEIVNCHKITYHKTALS